MTLLLGIIYVAFISLGLPDALLGSAWPTMHLDLQAPVSYAGILSMIITSGTIVSSMFSDKLTRKLGTGKVTAISVALTAAALFGFSVAPSFWVLCLCAIPYGLGAGAVDATLNNYIALHYEARHMSWLHCFWGLGASTGPYIMGACLTGGLHWSSGYRIVSVLQIVLTFVLFMSLPLWKGNRTAGEEGAQTEELGFGKLLKLPGAKAGLLAFFCYCALENTAGLWASSYMVMHRGVSETVAAGWAALFYLGITAGRFVSGFVTMKMNDRSMVRLGQGIAVVGIALLCLPLGNGGMCAGLAMIGVGCAPIYPSLLHETPENFGAERSQSVMGLQMACAYMGTTLMPPVFGFLAENVTIALYPVFMLVIVVLMVAGSEKLNQLHRIKR